MKTIVKNWKYYKKLIAAQGVDKDLIKIMEHSFYAGAASFIKGMVETDSMQDLQKYIIDFCTELDQYQKSIAEQPVGK